MPVAAGLEMPWTGDALERCETAAR